MNDRIDLTLDDGRVVRAHAAGAADPDAPVLVVHYGSPHTGAHLPPLLAEADRRGLRLLSVTRAGYPGSTRLPGRRVVDVADDLTAVLDRLGVGRFAALGYSGGGPPALAQAARLGDRVIGVATFASPAPFDGTDAWFAGMAGGGPGIVAARGGRTAREAFEATAEFDPAVFTQADWAALDGEWGALGADAGAAGDAGGALGLVDDDLGFVVPWGVGLESIRSPVLLVQGDDDRVIPPHHATRLAALVPGAEVVPVPGAGHVAVLTALPTVLDRLLG